MRPRKLFPPLFIAILATASLCAATVTLTGRVVDENDAPIANARIVVHLAAFSLQTSTGPTGAFSITLPEPGDYLVDAERQGFYASRNQTVPITTTNAITLSLGAIHEVFQSVNVKEQPSPLDLAQTQSEQRLTGTEINNIPFAAANSLKSSLKLMPGVVQDPTGNLHANGSSEDQVQYILNGFNITDPITGQFHTRLAVEGVSSVDFRSGRYSSEYGKGSAGVLAIRTENGTDAFHYTATNFLPGLNFQQGTHLGSWYPRVGVSGPIIPGRAWFADNLQLEYNQGFVAGLPRGENTRDSWAASNLFHTHFNLTPSNILSTDILVNTDRQRRVGLGPLDPVSTSSNLHAREYFGSVRDQIYLGHGALVEFGYAHNYFADSQIPQGSELYQFSNTGRSGNFYINSRQSAARDQWLVDGYAPTFHFFGTHQFKTGIDATRLSYSADFRRTGFQVLGLDGIVLSQTIFQGSGVYHFNDLELAGFVQDTWRVTKNFQLDLGFRQDYDQRLGDSAWSPRIAFSWSPFASGNTRVSGGFAVTTDAIHLGFLGRGYDQSATTTSYAISTPTLTNFAPPDRHLLIPTAHNWTLGIDRRLTERITVSANFLSREGSHGFAYRNTLDPYAPPSESPIPNTGLDSIYQPANLRRDSYNQATFSARQTLASQFEWMASYTHSRAVSNAVLDFQNSDPMQIVPSARPVPWDVPNRMMGWAYLPLPLKNWAVSALADARTGFAYSVRDETGQILGPVDSRRYPFNFSLNMAIERQLTFRGYRFAVRGGANNLTNQLNPTAVNNVAGAPTFLSYYGHEGRHYVVRLRFFGKSGK